MAEIYIMQKGQRSENPKETAKVRRSTSHARDVCQITAVVVNHTQQT